MLLGCLHRKLLLRNRGRGSLVQRNHLLRQMWLSHDSLWGELLRQLSFFRHNLLLLWRLRHLLLLHNRLLGQPLGRSCLRKLLRDSRHSNLLRRVLLLRNNLRWKLLLRDNLLRRSELMLRGKLLLGLRSSLVSKLMLYNILCDILLLLHCLRDSLVFRDSLQHLLLRNTLHNLLRRSQLLLRNSLHRHLLGLGHLLLWNFRHNLLWRGNLPLLHILLGGLLHHMLLRH